MLTWCIYMVYLVHLHGVFTWCIYMVYLHGVFSEVLKFLSQVRI